jgi:hypothetical protein
MDWTQWRSGLSAGTLRSMKTRHRRSTSLIELVSLSLFLHWMDRISNL